MNGDIMRTNIVIDDGLMAEAMALSGLKTKKDVVDRALRLLVLHYEQKQVKQLRGKLTWQGDLAALREGRNDASG